MPLHIRKTIHITGMTCPQCEAAIRRALLSLNGLTEADVRLRSGTAEILFDSMQLDEETIRKAVEAAGYGVASTAASRSWPEKAFSDNQQSGDGVRSGVGPLPAGLSGVARTLLPFGLLLVGLLLASRFSFFSFLPEITASMGYGMLFVTGLLTSLHCIGMCGGINLSQCLTRPSDTAGASGAAWKPSLAYNLGRVVSYTAIGGIVGAIGSVFSLPGAARGLFAIIAGLFTIVMGLSLLGTFPALHRIIPRLPASLRARLLGVDGRRGPFLVGLLNGLMPCGPLQAMQLYALGTGSALAGALSMLFFSLGTLPAMFALGAVGSLLGHRFRQGMMRAGALIVIVLGLVLIQRGLSLGGLAPDLAWTAAQPASATTAGANTGAPAGAPATDPDGFQLVAGEVSRGAYPDVTVKKGIPVRLNLHADAGTITGCNRTVVFPEYGIELDLREGDNIVEFTPDRPGAVGYTCWMGMVSGTITVKE